MMQRHLAIAFTVMASILAACAPEPPAGFRDPTVPMGATTRFDALAFSGEWVLVASFGPRATTPLRIALAPEVAHLRITTDEVPEIAGLYREGVPGELIPVSGVGETLAVMWVAEDFETAAIGTASGSFGAILNRTANLRDDRARAARDIFAFYGWDVSQLKRTIP